MVALLSDATVIVAVSSGGGTFYQADPARRNIGLQANGSKRRIPRQPELSLLNFLSRDSAGCGSLSMV